MSQVMTVKLKLLPTKEQSAFLKISSLIYINTVNSLVSEMIQTKELTKKTSKDIDVLLNSSVKNQVIRDAKSVFNKTKKKNYTVRHILKKPVILWNNQNFKVLDEHISVPLIIKDKSKRVSIKMIADQYELDLLNSSSKIGTLRITQKNKKWIAQIAIECSIPTQSSAKVMGVDLGIKIPAVCSTDEDEVLFAGNGKQNKYIRRRYGSCRKKLGRVKKQNAIDKMNNKEQRYMKDQDHKISRSIVAFAVSKNVGVIKLEQLINIRKQTSKSRKNNRSLSNWSFYRLAMYIEYKANLLGIKVEYVDPSYTSQSCPNCTIKNKAKDRQYKCECGYSGHRDLVGAKNIRYAPVLDGKSLTA
ncbi:RNA-guided endonuclease InsQ/TnpB family protein [Shouchella shacheensis]|uniref:RNA-guided endonuclease InsQ/TnpB family protein n=1 Tax=Shouchella shacheensis TaxID=1649580 RepID=UPI00074023AB|nr:RNA-guided endonuclease TnpB family protein [Shouchella shacheensis]